jgi:F-type H+-transporting ATPase subunit a
LAAEGADGAGHHGPLEQFEIQRLFPLEVFGFDASFTNAALYMVIAVLVISAFLILAMGRRALVPGRVQSMAELSYEYVAGMVRNALGEEGMQFFPWVFSIFMFVLVLNLIGMIPGAFTVTSHLIVTFALAAMVWTTVVIVGFIKNGPGFLRLFVPSGVPWILMPLIVPIELITFLMRPVSHSVRLFANMMAGHTMLKVFAGFAVGFISLWAPLAVLPAIFLVAFTGLEFLVAFLQALIFAVLTCIYLKDALHPHH